ncbi:MAG: hypothetical protein ACKV2T_41770 [Kofleriaceae bacterium]
MQNPWKLTTLLLAGGLLVSGAHADTDWKKNAITHLESAAKILAEHGGSKSGKSPERAPDKKADGTPASKALQLTRAAIVQLRRVE